MVPIRRPDGGSVRDPCGRSHSGSWTSSIECAISSIWQFPPVIGWSGSEEIGRVSIVSASTISFRICFYWKAGDAYDVEITDYH